MLVTGVIVLLAAAAVAASISFLNAQMQRRVAQKALMDSQREFAQSIVARGADRKDRIGLFRLRRAYEIANRPGLAANTDIPRDEEMSKSARRLLAGWQASI